MAHFLRLPVVVQLILLLAPAMLLVALIAVILGDAPTSSVFAIYAAMVMSVGVMAALAVWGRSWKWSAMGRGLTALIGVYILVPLLAALPLVALHQAGRGVEMTMGMAYFEMASAFTTTGATLFEPGDLPQAAHFWRALVAWIGGGVTLVVAFSIMAPLHIGGFEMGDSSRRMTWRDDVGFDRVSPAARLTRVIQRVLPIYGALTAFLALILMTLGEGAFVAVCHAMSVLSTSGISPVGGLDGTDSGWMGEVVVFAFLLTALSHRVFGGAGVFGAGGPIRDPEVRTGAALVLVVTFALMMHRTGALMASDAPWAPMDTIAAAWGKLFTVASFLTTTGFQSAHWDGAIDHTELPAVGLVLLTLAFAGGGIATTAGGIKLLRIFALYKHGIREIEKLVHPSSIGGYGATARRIRREGAYVAWIFVMLFFLTYGGLVLALTASGAGFDAALVMSGAALSNTGPLVGAFGPEMAGYGDLTPEGRGLLCIGMLVGRVEVLAVVAVLNPEYWRG